MRSNSAVESFFGSLQVELLNEHRWETRQELALAIFDWIETWYSPSRRHSYCGMLSPVDYEASPHHRLICGMINITTLSGKAGEAHPSFTLTACGG